MSNPWFRLYAEFAGDPVIQSLAFEDQRHFVVLMCLKCDGVLDRPIAAKARDRIIFRGLGLDPVAASEVKRRLSEVGLIDSNWQPSGWNKRQFVSDVSTARVRKSRRKSLTEEETGNVPETFQKRFGNAPDTDTDTDTDTEQKNSDAKATRFRPPSVEQVTKYCRERGNRVDPETFVDHYTAKGWKVGSSAMKDWKAAVRTWERRDNTVGTVRSALPLGNDLVARQELGRLCRDAGIEVQQARSADDLRTLLRQRGFGQ